MKVAVRVDATLAIGTGHLGRCRTLARALRAQAIQPLFICRAMPEALRSSLDGEGFDAVHLPAALRAEPTAGGPAHAAWLEADPLQDAEDTIAAIARLRGRVDWLIVDHYALDAGWHARLRAVAGRLLVIDDLADRPLDCDLLLDQTFGRDEAPYRARVPRGARMLLGTSHALLRPEFARLRPAALQRRRKAPAQRVLVSFGGMDVQNMSMLALNAVAREPAVTGVDVVLGGGGPHLGAIARRVAEFERGSIHVDTPDMAGLMAAADVAIGACGFSSWERCCLGLPTIAFAVAANQAFAADQLRRAGAVSLVSMESADGAGEIARSVHHLMANADSRRRMGEAAAAVCDGEGVRRVVAAMQESGA